MESENTAVTVLTLLFGVLIGIMSIISLLYFGGFISVDQGPRLERQSILNPTDNEDSNSAISNRYGMTFTIDKHASASGYVTLSCDVDNDSHNCDAEANRRLCDQAFALACFKPDYTLLTPADLSEHNPAAWSAGVVKLTRPVTGSEINTADDGHALCADSFGTGWRMLNPNDSADSGQIIAAGEISGPQQVWVDNPARPAAICWTPRPEYP